GRQEPGHVGRAVQVEGQLGEVGGGELHAAAPGRPPMLGERGRAEPGRDHRGGAPEEQVGPAVGGGGRGDHGARRRQGPGQPIARVSTARSAGDISGASRLLLRSSRFTGTARTCTAARIAAPTTAEASCKSSNHGSCSRSGPSGLPSSYGSTGGSKGSSTSPR